MVLINSAFTDSTLPYFCPGAKFGKNENKFDEFVTYCAPAAWDDFFQLPEVKTAVQTISSSLKSKDIEPQMPRTFRALEFVAPSDIKVVIIGQDPTPQPGEATGLAFSVNDPRTVGSVLNVLLEVALEGWSVDISNGDLTKWANQGVLLLNSALTVKQNNAGSHLAIWRTFTELLIEYISKNAKQSVWLLWGNHAQYFRKKISEKEHYVITGGHPSTLGGLGSTGNTFFGGNYFYCANDFLTKSKRGPIDWGLAVPNDVRLAVKSPLNACPLQPVILPPLKKIKTF